jgi:N-acetylmuramoyl-L-alanine amidase
MFRKKNSIKILSIVLLLLSFFPAISVAQKKFTIVIDAGHGGKDPGAKGLFSFEKNINLSVALKLGEMIEKQHPDVQVLYTRKTDVYLTVAERPKFANDSHADLFISIHVNASSNKAVAGAETFTLGMAKSQENLEVAMLENSVILLEDDYKQKYQGFDPNSIESYIMFEFMQDKYLEHSVKLASMVQSQLINVCNRKDRGVRQAGFLVLKNTAMPSILVELGFISNKEEEVYLNSKEGQDRSALAIYNAFLSFKQEYDRKSGNVNGSKSLTPAVGIRTPSDKPSSTTISDIQSLSSEEKKTESEELKNEVKVVAPKSTPKPEPAKPTQTVVNPPKPEQAKPTQTAVNVPKPEPANQEIIQENKLGKTYRVQIFAGKALLDLNDQAFKGLKNVSFYVEKGLYKYTYGDETPNLNQALRTKREIASYFPDAFIVTFIDGEKVTK